MKPLKEKSFLPPLKRKVIAAFLLACTAIALAVGITYLSFYGLLEKVDQLSAPNNKLKILNNLFEEITRLDQQQRADAIRNPQKPYKDYLKETRGLTLKIDSLSMMQWESGNQLERLEAMKQILDKRNYILINYLKLRSNFISNEKYASQVDSLATILTERKTLLDSNITIIRKKTITTTNHQLDKSKKAPFFSRIFGKKKTTDSVENTVDVKEEVSINVDTIAVAKQDSTIREMGEIMKSLEEDQRIQSRQILRRELDLISTNIILINKLLSILKEVENEEITTIQQKNREAGALVTGSINRIAVILIVFFLSAALLVFLILLDISKSNYYRLKLIEAKELAEQLSSVKQRFLANMSHEIRTPLQSIIGFTEQLKNPKVKDEALDAIQSSSEHLLHIVNEMLDYSRIESDTFTITKAPFDLEDLIDEVSEVIRIQAEKKSLQFEVIKKDLPTVKLYGDAFRLRQIFYNLLGNAVKFTKKGFVRFEIEAGYDLLIQCRFCVMDSGIGITPEDATRIFGQFEQGSSHHSQEFGGAGLGLTIVKKLVDLHHGHIYVDSKLNHGSTFTVVLSFEKARITTDEKSKLITVANVKPFSGQIIIVDDDPLILRFCSLLLEQNHFSFKAIQQPQKIFKEDLQDVKVIFLDIRMPGISGIEVCKELRKKNKEVKIVALTAHIMPQELSSLKENGFDEILIKPFRENDFLKILGIATIKNTVFDLSAVRQMTMGDESLFHSILEQYMAETQKNLNELTQQLNTNNFLATREIIHKLLGRTAQIGAKGIANSLFQIEKNLDAHQPLETLMGPIVQTVDQLKLLLKDLQKEIVATE